MSSRISARRLVFAGVVGAALVLAPAAASFASLNGQQGSQTLAGCTMTRSGTSSSMVCSPDIAPGGIVGAPTQEDITAKNAQRARTRGGL
jgi:hypothetical protein